MEMLKRTNDRFREGVSVQVIRVESLTTMWVRLAGCPKITNVESLPRAKGLRTGMLVAVLAGFQDARTWERAILLERTMTGYIVFLIDWGLESEKCLGLIRLLPPNLAEMAPWARKIVLPGVREQPIQGNKHQIAQFTMLRQRGSLVDIDPSPGDAITARLLLNQKAGEPPIDIRAHYLELGYLDLQ